MHVAAALTKPYTVFTHSIVCGTLNITHLALTSHLISSHLISGELAKGEAEKGGLQKKFKLDGNIATTNMMMFDMNSMIRKFERCAKRYLYSVLSSRCTCPS